MAQPKSFPLNAKVYQVFDYAIGELHQKVCNTLRSLAGEAGLEVEPQPAELDYTLQTKKYGCISEGIVIKRKSEKKLDGPAFDLSDEMKALLKTDKNGKRVLTIDQLHLYLLIPSGTWDHFTSSPAADDGLNEWYTGDLVSNL